MARLTLDSRDLGLAQQLVAMRAPHSVESLAVGNVFCAYPGQGCDWVVKRKRADNLAAGIVDGRWREQTGLFDTDLRVLFVVEGDLRCIDGMYEAMLGGIVSASTSAPSMDATEMA